jgi:hypothetical protein
MTTMIQLLTVLRGKHNPLGLILQQRDVMQLMERQYPGEFIIGLAELPAMYA